jgi:hypothetical protein
MTLVVHEADYSLITLEDASCGTTRKPIHHDQMAKHIHNIQQNKYIIKDSTLQEYNVIHKLKITVSLSDFA